MIAKYLGQTAMKTRNVLESARGGVLLIDEAYSLGHKENRDMYSKECIDTINQNLTERQGEFICIIAGYKDSVEKCFFSYNPGLHSRFTMRINMDEYEAGDLIKISNPSLTQLRPYLRLQYARYSRNRRANLQVIAWLYLSNEDARLLL